MKDNGTETGDVPIYYQWSHIVFVTIFVSMFMVILAFGAFASTYASKQSESWNTLDKPLVHSMSGVEASKMLLRGHKLIDTLVRGDLVLSRRRVDNPVYIVNCEIQGNLLLGDMDHHSYFVKSLIFSHVAVNGNAYLSNISFKDVLYIGKSAFKKAVLIRKITFLEEADIKSSSFDGFFEVENARSNKQFTLLSLTFNDNIEISDSNIKYINISSTFNKGLFVYRVKANIFDISESSFKGPLTLTKTNIKKINISDLDLIKELTKIDWSIVKNKVISRGNMEIVADTTDSRVIRTRSVLHYEKNSYNEMMQYLDLSNIYRANGLFDDADSAYYMYCIKKREQMKWGASKILSYIQDLTCGYCTMPFRSFVVGIILAIVFTVFYFPRNAIKSDHISLCENEDKLSRFRNALYYSFNTFTTVGTGDFYPNTKLTRFCSMIEGFLGYVFMALFLVTITSKILR